MSTIPAVVEEMDVEPYAIDWLIPQYNEAGEVEVTELQTKFSMQKRNQPRMMYSRIGDGAGELAGVGATEGDLTIRGLLRGCGCERYRNQVRGNEALREGISGD